MPQSPRKMSARSACEFSIKVRDGQEKYLLELNQAANRQNLCLRTKCTSIFAGTKTCQVTSDEEEDSDESSEDDDTSGSDTDESSNDEDSKDESSNEDIANVDNTSGDESGSGSDDDIFSKLTFFPSSGAS